jgi:hypothetical protein
MALQSSLHTTQIQSDNIRQLFSALTSPRTLPHCRRCTPQPHRSNPLSIRAPMPPARAHSGKDLNHMPRTRARTMSVPDVPSEIDKRATWNGSYSNLARSNTSPCRCSGESLTAKTVDPRYLPPLMRQTPSFSAPVTPFLDGVKEEVPEELETAWPGDRDTSRLHHGFGRGSKRKGRG